MALAAPSDPGIGALLGLLRMAEDPKKWQAALGEFDTRKAAAAHLEGKAAAKMAEVQKTVDGLDAREATLVEKQDICTTGFEDNQRVAAGLEKQKKQQADEAIALSRAREQFIATSQAESRELVKREEAVAVREDTIGEKEAAAAAAQAEAERATAEANATIERVRRAAA